MKHLKNHHLWFECSDILVTEWFAVSSRKLLTWFAWGRSVWAGVTNPNYLLSSHQYSSGSSGTSCSTWKLTARMSLKMNIRNIASWKQEWLDFCSWNSKYFRRWNGWNRSCWRTYTHEITIDSMFSQVIVFTRVPMLVECYVTILMFKTHIRFLNTKQVVRWLQSWHEIIVRYQTQVISHAMLVRATGC